jgi:hypothetical protein
MDATGSVKGPIGLAMILFASVVPLSIAFRYFKSGAFVASKGNV